MTEFVLKTHTVPASVVSGSLTSYPRRKPNESEHASWVALAGTTAQFPVLMDTGITVIVTSVTGGAHRLSEAIRGAAASVSLTSYNPATASMDATFLKMHPKSSRGVTALLISLWHHGISRLNELVKQPALRMIRAYLQQISVAQDTEKDSMLLFGMQAVLGPANASEKRRGSVLPA
ncbi:hypothetical protein N7523_004867 [Penicillium sp. IBT 18751x]|nr:hypothetical protein N7523_004867 [Penicillium sp. IBT 18751x]